MKRGRQRIVVLFTLAAVAASLGCGTAPKKEAMDVTLKSEQQRREIFEATLRVLDEHPEYVDEFFLNAMQHPKTMDRFLQNASAHLKEERLSRMNATHLARHPDSLKQIMIATLDEISDEPKSQAALADAISERAHVAAMVMTAQDDTIPIMFRSLLVEIKKRPESRRAFLKAMAESGPTIAELMIDNPETAAALMKALGGAAVREVKDEVKR
jgi:hypothetical protein